VFNLDIYTHYGTHQILITGATGYIGRRLWFEPGRLIQTAHYYPNGLWGRLYWYMTNPFHNLVFQDPAEKIVEYARQIG
jgi:hypothetical protein